MNFHFQNNFQSRVKNQKGSLLILVLFALTILSLLAFSVGYTVRQKLAVATRLEAREKLRLAAEAVANQASILLSEKIGKSGGGSYQSLNQAWAQNEPLWKDVKLGGVDYSVVANPEAEGSENVYGLLDEDRKINLNTAKPAALQTLFEVAADVDQEEARRIVAAIRDWKDEDEDLMDGGAESKDYLKLPSPYRSKNALFNDLQELLWVQGVTRVIFDKVKPYLTLDASLINLNTASATVLTAMGLEPAIVSKILEYRKGKDGKAGTADDGVFSSLSEVSTVISRYSYLSETDVTQLNSVLETGFSVQSTFFTANIKGKLQHQKQGIRATVVLDQNGGIRRWHEEFI